MGGLGKLFSRIIPIIMLVCFVCLGITHTFNQIGAENKTYLTTETINVGTQENPNNITYYNLDINTYLTNINVDILKEATNNVIDTKTFDDNLTSFNIIWENGYQVGAITNTILNAVILIINVFLTTINLILFPIRLIAGILLTGMAIVGINISTDGVITNSLKSLLYSLSIPLIKPTTSTDEMHDPTNTYWTFKNIMNNQSWRKGMVHFSIKINNNEWIECDALESSPRYLSVWTANGNNKLDLWTSANGWENENYKNIYIISVTGSQNVKNNVYSDLESIATIVSNRQIEYTQVENETKSYIRYAI